MAWWIDRPWNLVRDTVRFTLPCEDKEMLLSFWEQILPLACCTSQLFSRVSLV